VAAYSVKHRLQEIPKACHHQCTAPISFPKSVLESLGSGPKRGAILAALAAKLRSGLRLKEESLNYVIELLSKMFSNHEKSIKA
jgi:hypothetical protein